MADYHEIVDQIRAFLQASDQTRTDRLDGLASAFAGACTEVNHRLGRCHRFVQQGLRSEAIQLAEAAPRLLDAVATLEFPERAQWDELVEIYDLPVAPRLLADAAEALAQSYAEAEPLQDLLRTHRRLSMQRAAVRARIAVLRKLAARDPDSPVWPEELRALEKARARQIPVEAAEAARLQDVAHLGRLVAEVREGTWLEPPPKPLIHGLVKAEGQLRVQQARAAMVEVECRLIGALAARDAIAGRAAREEWTALVDAAAPGPDDPVRDRVGPSLRWLEEEDRAAASALAHEMALAALGRALDEPDVYDLAELERLGQEVLKFGRAMPEAMRRRYADRVGAMRAARARRSRLIRGAAVAAVLLVVGLGGWAFRRYYRAGDADGAAAEIARMIDAGEFERASAFVASLRKADSGLLGEASLVGMLGRFEEERRREEDRAGRFQEAMERARRAPVGPAGPKALREARDLARHGYEKEAVVQLGARLQAVAEEERQRREERLRPRLDAIVGQVDGIEARLGSPPVDQAGILAMLAAARQAIGELGPEIEEAGEVSQSRARSLGERLDAVTGRLEALRRRLDHEEDLTRAVADAASGREDAFRAFADRLRAFAKAYPDDPRSTSFGRVVEEQSLWAAAAEWDRLVGGWMGPVEALSPEEAGRRAGACRSFRERNPRFPDADDLAAYQRHIEAIARRASGSSPAAKLRRVLSAGFIDGVWQVKVRDAAERQRSYYTRERPIPHDGSLEFRSLVALDGKERPRSFVADWITAAEVAPQSRIADRFKPILVDESRLRPWEAVMGGLVGAILDERGIDPILQVDLLRAVVPTAGEGSEPFRIAWEPVKGRLDRAGIDVTVAWVDPEQPGVDRVRADAAQVIRAVRNAVPGPREIQAARERIERVAGRTYRAVGWLDRDRDGPAVRLVGTAPHDGPLGVIVPEGTGPSAWRRVGSLAGSRASLDPAARSALAEGRPVFAIRGRSL